MFIKTTRILTVFALFALAACGETNFQDFFGAGKYSPDETQVRTNRPLSAPSDLRLPEPRQANGAGNQPMSGNREKLSTSPPQYGQAPNSQYAATQNPGASGDVYARNGIMRLRPDGTPKTEAELIAELRRLKLKRRAASTGPLPDIKMPNGFAANQ